MWPFLAIPLLIPAYYILMSFTRVGWLDWLIHPERLRHFNDPVDEALFRGKYERH